MKGKLFALGAVLVIALFAVVFLVSSPDGGDEKRTARAGDKDDSLFNSMPSSSPAAKPIQDPRALAQARAMHKALPGNVFLPPLGDQADNIRMDRRNHKLNQLRKLHFKIEKETASSDERASYYEFRVKYNRDKIAMLQYVAVRGKSGDKNSMAPHITKMIADLRREIETFQAKTPPR